MWHPEECENEDSCNTGQTHMYPEPGTLVEVLVPNKWQLIGSARTFVVSPGVYTIGEFVDHEGHQASVEVAKAGGPHDLVWIDIDELHAEGWCLDSPVVVGRVA